MYKDQLDTLQNGNLGCYDLTGKLLWEQTFAGKISSPIIVNGKLFFLYDGVTMCAASRGKPTFYKAALPHTELASPGYGEGKLVLRQVDCIACYDLTKK
jgi:outer membrane protein assembly factor BamB